MAAAAQTKGVSKSSVHSWFASRVEQTPSPPAAAAAARQPIRSSSSTSDDHQRLGGGDGDVCRSFRCTGDHKCPLGNMCKQEHDGENASTLRPSSVLCPNERKTGRCTKQPICSFHHTVPCTEDDLQSNCTSGWILKLSDDCREELFLHLERLLKKIARAAAPSEANPAVFFRVPRSCGFVADSSMPTYEKKDGERILAYSRNEFSYKTSAFSIVDEGDATVVHLFFSNVAAMLMAEGAHPLYLKALRTFRRKFGIPVHHGVWQWVHHLVSQDFADATALSTDRSKPTPCIVARFTIPKDSAQAPSSDIFERLVVVDTCSTYDQLDKTPEFGRLETWLPRMEELMLPEDRLVELERRGRAKSGLREGASFFSAVILKRLDCIHVVSQDTDGSSRRVLDRAARMFSISARERVRKEGRQEDLISEVRSMDAVADKVDRVLGKTEAEDGDEVLLNRTWESTERELKAHPGGLLALSQLHDLFRDPCFARCRPASDVDPKSAQLVRFDDQDCRFPSLHNFCVLTSCLRAQTTELSSLSDDTLETINRTYRAHRDFDLGTVRFLLNPTRKGITVARSSMGPSPNFCLPMRAFSLDDRGDEVLILSELVSQPIQRLLQSSYKGGCAPLVRGSLLDVLVRSSDIQEAGSKKPTVRPPNKHRNRSQRNYGSSVPNRS